MVGSIRRSSQNTVNFQKGRPRLVCNSLAIGQRDDGFTATSASGIHVFPLITSPTLRLPPQESVGLRASTQLHPGAILTFRYRGLDHHSGTVSTFVNEAASATNVLMFPTTEIKHLSIKTTVDCTCRDSSTLQHFDTSFSWTSSIARAQRHSRECLTDRLVDRLSVVLQLMPQGSRRGHVMNVPEVKTKW